VETRATLGHGRQGRGPGSGGSRRDAPSQGDRRYAPPSTSRWPNRRFARAFETDLLEGLRWPSASSFVRCGGFSSGLRRGELHALISRKGPPAGSPLAAVRAAASVEGARDGRWNDVLPGPVSSPPWPEAGGGRGAGDPGVPSAVARPVGRGADWTNRGGECAFAGRRATPRCGGSGSAGRGPAPAATSGKAGQRGNIGPERIREAGRRRQGAYVAAGATFTAFAFDRRRWQGTASAAGATADRDDGRQWRARGRRQPRWAITALRCTGSREASEDCGLVARHGNALRGQLAAPFGPTPPKEERLHRRRKRLGRFLGASASVSGRR